MCSRSQSWSALALAGYVDLSETIYLGSSLQLAGLVVGGLAFGVGMTLAGGCGGRVSAASAAISWSVLTTHRLGHRPLRRLGHRSLRRLGHRPGRGPHAGRGHLRLLERRLSLGLRRGDPGRHDPAAHGIGEFHDRANRGRAGDVSGNLAS